MAAKQIAYSRSARHAILDGVNSLVDSDVPLYEYSDASRRQMLTSLIRSSTQVNQTRQVSGR